MSLQTINLERLQLKPNDRVLDLGCGEGRHAISACLAEDVESVAVDLSAADLLTTRRRFDEFMGVERSADKCLLTSVADGQHLPFANESFNQAICAEMLEHVPDYRAVITEIHRVVKHGGILAISVPRFFPEWVCWQLSDAYHEVEGGHIRIFNARHLRHDLEASGFIFCGKHHAHALHVPYWWLKCLYWQDAREADTQPERGVVAWYHRFLVWDLMQQPLLTRLLDWCLNPIMGKSVVMYFVKESKSGATPE